MRLNSRPGQTILELVLASAVILTTTITTVSVIVITITAGRASQNRVEAANFAREGIEVVRALRDSNWLKGQQNIPDGTDPVTRWDDNGLGPNYDPLAGVVSGGVVDYFLLFSPASGWQLQAGGSFQQIYRHGTQLYHTQTACGGCQPTKFARTISFTQLSSNPTQFDVANEGAVGILSIVRWFDRLGEHRVNITARLHNWNGQ